MGLVDFTTFTEVDPNSDLTVTATRITVDTMRRDVSAYVYKDRGVGFFGGDYEHDVDVNCSAATANESEMVVWMLSNVVKDKGNHEAANDDFHLVTLFRWTDGLRIYLQERYGTSTYSDIYVGLSYGVTYYLTIKRDESIGTYGRLYCYIYSDSARTTLIDTLQLDLHEKEDFRYIYGLASRTSTGTQTISGYVENLRMPLALTQTVTEILGLVDTLARRVALKQTVSEILGMVESIVPLGALSVTVSEILGLKDRVEARKRAGKIGDLPDDTITGGA